MTQHDLRSDLPPFAMVPRWIIQHKELTSGAVRVYCCLADMAGRDRPAWPSHRTLAAKTNMSVSSVRRHLDELVKVGALHVKQRFRPEGEGQTSNLYTVTFKLSTSVEKSVNDKTVSSTENNPVSTDEQGGYSPVDNITITKEQEPSKTAKEHIAEARRMLKNDRF